MSVDARCRLSRGAYLELDCSPAQLSAFCVTALRGFVRRVHGVERVVAAAAAAIVAEDADAATAAVSAPPITLRRRIVCVRQLVQCSVP